MANLAWKLAAVVKGEVGGGAAETLLDSYGIERQAHVRELTTRIKDLGAVICERDIERARVRDARLLAECGGTVKDTPRQDVLPRLQGGCLSGVDSGARGALFPQPLLTNEHGETLPMDERFGRGWRLVVDDTLAAPAVRAPGIATIHIGVGGWHESHEVVAGWMRRHACHAALLRPDHYVFGVAATRAELDALLTECADRLHSALPQARPTATR